MKRTTMLIGGAFLVIGLLGGAALGAMTEDSDDARVEDRAEFEPPAVPEPETAAQVLQPIAVGSTPPSGVTDPVAPLTDEQIAALDIPTEPVEDVGPQPPGEVPPGLFGPDPDPPYADITDLLAPAHDEAVENHIAETCAGDPDCAARIDDMVERVRDSEEPGPVLCLDDSGCPDALPPLPADEPVVDCEPICDLIVRPDPAPGPDADNPTTTAVEGIATIDDVDLGSDELDLGGWIVDLEDLPLRMDPCFFADADEDCEGTAGVIHVATAAAMGFYGIDSQPTLPWPCRTGPERGDPPNLPQTGEVVVVVTSNQPGVFDLTYGPTDAGLLRAEPSFPPFEPTPDWPGTEKRSGRTSYWAVQTWESGLTEAVTTCINVPAPPAGQATELVLTGVPLFGDGDMGRLTGTQVLAAPSLTRPDQLRADRPPIQVFPRGTRTIEARVPAAPAERSSAVVVRRADDAPDQNRCRAFHEDALAPGDAFPMAPTHTFSVSDTDYPNLTVFETRIPPSDGDPSTWDICVEWTDDFTPPRVTERAFVTVVPPAQPRVDVLFGGVVGGPGWRKSGSLELAINSRCNRSYTLPARGADPLEVICSAFASGGQALFGVMATPTLDNGTTLDATPTLLRIDGQDCPTDVGAECTRWFEVPVRDGTDQVGVVLLGLRPSAVDFSTEWVVGGAEEAYSLDEAIETIYPRLNRETLTITPVMRRGRGTADTVAPYDPSVEVRWETSEAVATAVHLRPAAGPRYRCSDAADDQGVVSRRVLEPATEGRVTIGGLCPGTRYHVELDLWVETDGRHTFYRSSGSPAPGPGALYPLLDTVTTGPVYMEIDYWVAARSFEVIDGVEEPKSGRLAPVHRAFRIEGQDAEQLVQDFDVVDPVGPYGFGLVSVDGTAHCDGISDFDLATHDSISWSWADGTAPVVQVDGTLQVDLEDLWASPSVNYVWTCGTRFFPTDTLNFTVLPPFRISGQIPVWDLLDDGEAVVRSTESARWFPRDLFPDFDYLNPEGEGMNGWVHVWARPAELPESGACIGCG